MGWLVVVLGLALGLIGGCSSGSGSAMTGPTSQAPTTGAGAAAGSGTASTGSDGDQMM